MKRTSNMIPASFRNTVIFGFIAAAAMANGRANFHQSAAPAHQSAPSHQAAPARMPSAPVRSTNFRQASSPASHPSTPAAPARTSPARPAGTPRATSSQTFPKAKTPLSPTKATPPGGGNTTQPGGGNNQPGGGNSKVGGGNSKVGGGNNQPGGGNTQPGSGNSKVGGGNSKIGGGNNQPGGGNNQPGSGNSKVGGGNSKIGGSNNQPGGGNNQPGGGNSKIGGGNNQPGGGNSKIGGGNNQPGGGNNQPGGGNSQQGSRNRQPGGGDVRYPQSGLRNGGDVISRGHGPSRIERPPVMVHGRAFVPRVESRGGISVTHFYQPVEVHGVRLHVFAHERFFAPALYTWAETPWVGVHFRWGWMRAPWFAANAGYFTPEATYTGTPMWLTDYVIASSLQRSYQDGSVPTGSNPAAITPMIKGAVSSEVRGRVQVERAAQSNGDANPAAASVLDGSNHVLVAFDSIDASSNGQACSINGGDVVRFAGPAATNGANAIVQVLASRGSDCPAGSLASIPVDALQETENQMSDAVDQGLDYLRTHGGQDGLPVMPSAASAAVTQASFVSAAAAPAAPEAQPAPGNIYRGESINDVVAALGNPAQAVDLGAKQIYLYRNLKVTFFNGRVADVM